MADSKESPNGLHCSISNSQFPRRKTWASTWELYSCYPHTIRRHVRVAGGFGCSRSTVVVMSLLPAGVQAWRFFLLDHIRSQSLRQLLHPAAFFVHPSYRCLRSTRRLRFLRTSLINTRLQLLEHFVQSAQTDFDVESYFISSSHLGLDLLTVLCELQYLAIQPTQHNILQLAEPTLYEPQTH